MGRDTGNGSSAGRGPPATRMEGWRRLTAAAWKHPSDPQIFGDLEVDAEALRAYLADVRAATGVRVTVTHLVGKALAVALHEHPDLNRRIVGGRFVPRESVDIFFVVAAESAGDLSGVKVRHADEKPVVEIARELSERAARIRGGDDSEYAASKRLLGATPLWLLRRALRFTAWLTSDHDVDLRRLGLPRQTFGSAMVTSVGMFGIRHAYGPLAPSYRIPFLALVSEIADRPVVRDGQVVARPVLAIMATLDHRYLDGAQAAALARSVTAYLEDPRAHEGDPGRAAPREEVAAGVEGDGPR